MAKEPATKPPKKPGRFAQIKQVFVAAKAVDPAIGWWMALAALAVLVVAAILGIVFNALVYALILGIPLALLAATIVLSRRAERAAYKQIEGQPGAVGAALRSIRRGWFIEEQPVAADAQGPRTSPRPRWSTGRLAAPESSSSARVPPVGPRSCSRLSAERSSASRPASR
jgi:Flp pilus assembly protein TadB